MPQSLHIILIIGKAQKVQSTVSALHSLAISLAISLEW